MSALYEPRGDQMVATEYTRGPWSPDAQHGGAPAALLMRALERADPDPGRQWARVTYELLRPVPLGELQVVTSVLRPGRLVQLHEASLTTPDGTEVVRARALSVARSPVSAGAAEPPPEGPEHAAPIDLPPAWEGLVRFPSHGMEIRFAQGRFSTPGPSTAWFRLRVPVIAGETPSGLQRLAAAADFPNGTGTELAWEEWLFINPDLTIHIEREPEGEWIGLAARMHLSAGGVGHSDGVLYDRRGRVGRCLQSLYVAPR